MKRFLPMFASALVACSSPRARPPDGAPPADAPADTTAIDAPADAPDQPPDPFAALQAMPGTCTADGWCWRFPQPTANRYFSVYATAPDNIWLLGARGTVYQWDGHSWIVHHPPTLPGQDFVAWPFQIIGTGKNDMWMIMMSAVEHWNGATWTILDTGPVRTVPYFHQLWIAPNGDVIEVSNVGVARSQNGNPFQMIYSQTNLTSVWGFAADDFFVSGPGTIYHYDGTAFTQVFLNGPTIPGMMMGAKNDAWASGGNNTLLHWDGTTWTPVPTGLPSSAFVQAVTWRASNDAWWLTQASSNNQQFVHWDGTSITLYPIDTASYGDNCCPTLAAAAIIDDKWWIVGGDGGIYTKDGSNTIRPIIAPHYEPWIMWGTSDNDMYFSGSGPIAHWDGTTMTYLPSPTSSGGIAGIASGGIGGTNELFSVGYEIDWSSDPYQYVYSGMHYDGQTWTKTELKRSLPYGDRVYGIYAMAQGEAMAFGSNGLAYHYKDGTWTPVSTGTTATLGGIYGPDADHLWITGSGGTLLQWLRTSPDVMTPEPTFNGLTTNDLGSISGSGGTVVIANPNTYFASVNRNGTWSQMNTNTIASNVFAISSENIVVTSSTDDGHLSRWNGSEFLVEDYGYEGVMFNVFQPPLGHMWLTNGRGVAQHP
jgi:hypothetical protein